MLSFQYRRLILALQLPRTFDDPEVEKALLSLESLAFGQRKALITLCRSRSVPEPDSRLDLITDKIRLHPIVKPLLSYMGSAITSSLILSLTRLAPMPKEMQSEVENDAINKEFQITESNPLEPEINWNVILGSFHETLLPTLEPSSKWGPYFFNILQEWRSHLSSPEFRLLYPRMNDKTISRETARNFNDEHREYGEIERMTTRIVERMESEGRGHVEGPAEMRQRWTTANIGPRTYFANGGTSHDASKFIKEICNDLMDRIPCINRRMRTDNNRLVLREGCHAIIYDLSSFTSNLHVQRRFMYILAIFLQGTMVRAIDPELGIVMLDAGDLMRRAADMHNCAEFSMEWIDPKLADFLFQHNTAGFLGVPSNITVATIIHGIVASFLVESQNELNIAGDDGLVGSDDEARVLRTIQYLGRINPERCYVTHQSVSVSLKRSVVQVGQRVLSAVMVFWPNFEMVGAPDPRYSRDLRRLHFHEKQAKAASSLVAFRRSLLGVSSLNERETFLISDVMRYFYRAMSLSPRGSLAPLYPPRDADYLVDWRVNMVADLYPGFWYADLQEFVDIEDFENEAGVSFVCNMTPGLRLAKDLGYVVAEVVERCYVGEEGYRRCMSHVLQLFDFDVAPAVYNVIIIDPIPAAYL